MHRRAHVQGDNIRRASPRRAFCSPHTCSMQVSSDSEIACDKSRERDALMSREGVDELAALLIARCCTRCSSSDHSISAVAVVSPRCVLCSAHDQSIE